MNIKRGYWFISIMMLACKSWGQVPVLWQLLQQMDAQLQLRFNQYDAQRYSRLIQSSTVAFPASPGVPKEITVNGVGWKVQYSLNAVSGIPYAAEVQVHFKVLNGVATESSVSLDLTFANWRTENYVLAPAALYNGNRFDARIIPYSPKLHYYAPGYKNPVDEQKNIPADIGKDVPTIISDVPRLANGGGVSRVQLRSGDMSTPAVGFFSPAQQRIGWVLTEQGNALGDYGIDIEETKDRRKAIVSITAPVVREMYQYKIASTREPSNDRGYSFQPGDTFTVRFFLFSQPATDVQALFNAFRTLRTLPVYNRNSKQELPFSAAARVMVDGLNHNDWNEPFDYYSLGSWKRWTPGWTGGFQLLYGALLSQPDSLTKSRVMRNLRFAFENAVAPSGFFWEAIEGRTPVAGDLRRPHTHNWHLVRRSADGLFYALLVMQHLDRTENGWAKVYNMPNGYQDSIKKVADAFVKLWRQEQQLGQFVNNHTGNIIVGGSASGSLVPGALALAAKYYVLPHYLEVAKDMMRYYDSAFICKGYTTGGPGDALQNPDSESAYSFVESALALYEATGNTAWLDMAGRIATQFATWVSSYNYRFPASSAFGRLGILSNGAVWANSQNKHGSPNICTHGGLGLLKLYIATNDSFYGELVRDIVHNAVQYISRKDKPIGLIPFGGVDERCSTTDWLEGIGEVMNQTTWAQVANMLSVGQLPGLVVRSDGSFLMLDHFDAILLKKTKRGYDFQIHNPTPYNGVLKVWVENSGDNINQPEKFLEVPISAGTLVKVKLYNHKMTLY